MFSQVDGTLCCFCFYHRWARLNVILWCCFSFCNISFLKHIYDFGIFRVDKNCYTGFLTFLHNADECTVINMKRRTFVCHECFYACNPVLRKMRDFRKHLFVYFGNECMESKVNTTFSFRSCIDSILSRVNQTFPRVLRSIVDNCCSAADDNRLCTCFIACGITISAIA